jgi:excisionase family DNA binding protein
MTGQRAKIERPRKRLYSIPEAGEYLGRTPWTIREMIWKGKLPAVRDGRRILLDINDLDQWIEANKVVRDDD